MNNRLFSRNDLVRLIIPLIVDQFLQVARRSFRLYHGRPGRGGSRFRCFPGRHGHASHHQYFHGSRHRRRGDRRAVSWKKRSEDRLRGDRPAFNFTFLFSIFIMILGYLGQNVILYHVFGKIEPEVMKDSRTYLLIVLSSIPMIAMYNAGAAIFRAMGNSNVAMKTSLLMNSINVFGNALLIFGFHCGVEGVAIPTVVSRGVACVVILILLNNQKHELHHFCTHTRLRSSGMC